MQPHDSSGSGGAGASREEKVKTILIKTLEKLPQPFNLAELSSKT